MKRWNKREDTMLCEWYGVLSNAEIAQRLCRTKKSVECRAATLRIQRTPAPESPISRPAPGIIIHRLLG